MGKSTLAPHASVAGFAIFLVVYATQIWGGVFPFLPTDFQTQEVTLTFYLSQSLAFCASYVASAFGSYYVPSAARRMLVTLSISLAFIGSCFIIAVMYVPMFTLGFIIAGGAFLGVGCAGIFMLWQRYFSSISAPECNWRLIAGTAFGSLLYFMLYLIPNSLTAFLIPVVLLPICALCLSLSVREMDFDQSMFEDIPREHPQVYTRMLHDFWRSAGGLGALAFAAGLARGVAIVEPDIQIAVNTTSMAGVLIACGFLIVAWRWFPFQFSLRSAFRAVYPIMFTGLLLFPFAQGAGLTLFASVAYTVFSIMVLVLMMQSAQIARDRGTNPVFAYAFFGACAYVPQALGFILGWITLDIDVMGIGKTAILSMLAAYALGMSLYFSAGTLLGPSKNGTPRRDDQIELTSGKVWKAPEEAMFSKGPTEIEEGAADAPVGSLQHSGRQSDKKPSKTRRPIGNDGFVITDRLSKQCLVLKRDYGLSARETEVCELIARGRSVAAIAEELFVSENTVRTHSKHIYTKLDIHSRQELGELLSTVDPIL